MITYRLATKKDISLLAPMAANEFKTYPLYMQFIKPGISSESDYLKFIEQVFKIQFRIEIRKGVGVLALDSGRPIGLAFLSPSLKENNLWDYFWSGGLRLFPYFKGGLLNGLLEKGDIAETACRKKADEDTWYLSVLAVNASYQGRGLGRTLLNEHVVPFLKKQQVKRLSLITNTEENCRFYEKSDFDCFDKTELVLNDQRVPNWCFIRTI